MENGENMTDEQTRVELTTLDLAAENRDALAALFPGVLDDGVLDAAKLGELLDTPVAQVPDGRERYGLQWAGKQEAIRSLLTPSRGTLVPDLERSIDFDTAQNVFIEGDNLEVLKLLQKAYNDKVKLIYIDPPYNTGNDFVYNDNFSDGLRGYLEYTGQVDVEGNRTAASADTTGRRHSKWLSMMYPRLVLARNLLTQDGAIFVSIDDHEVANLRALMDEVLGAENFLAQITVISNLKGRSDDQYFASAHSYLLAYRRSSEFRPLGVGLEQEYVESYREVDERGRYRNLPLRKSGTNSLRTDRPNMYFPLYVDPDTGDVRTESDARNFIEVLPMFPDGREGCWRWGQDTALERATELIARRVGSDNHWDIFQKDYLERDGVERRAVPKTVWTGPEFDNGRGTAEIKALLGGRVFDAPKPTSLITRMLEYATKGSDLVLDFFAGSGSTAHAVSLQNRSDGGHRRCISVNLPEETAEGTEARKAGYETVSAITHARLNKVIEMVEGARVMGLRTLVLNASNFEESEAAEGEFDLRVSTLASPSPDWEAVTAEALLKEGVTLDEKWERHSMPGAEIIVANGVAVVLSTQVNDAVVARAFDLNTPVVVFLEDGFAGADSVKANAFTNAKNLGITMKTI